MRGGWGFLGCGFLGYSPLRPAGRASPARRAPRRVLGGQEDPGSPAHPVRPRPPRGRGSRARPGYLAARGWRGSGVLSWVCVGFRVTARSTEDDGLGVRVPWGCPAVGCGALLTHLPLWSRLARFTLGTEDERNSMGKQHAFSSGLWGGGGTCTAPQECPPRVTPAPYLLALHPRKAVNAGVTLKQRQRSCETPTSTESHPLPHPAALELLLLHAGGVLTMPPLGPVFPGEPWRKERRG